MSAPGDYSALNTQLVFTDGQTTGALVCATLDIINDTVVEENEESHIVLWPAWWLNRATNGAIFPV